MQKIISVKHYGDKSVYNFVDNLGLKEGDKVVFSIDDFETIGTVSRVGIEVDKDKASELSSVKRKTTESDISKYDTLLKKAKENLVIIKKKSLELGLMMKFVGAEYSLDNSKIIITFSSEDRVDFRQLLKELASMLKTRIELKQIGQRDEVKVCGGVGPCGEPCCCARFLNDFEHVTVKMAKVQGLSLSPTKINGICGRLMCCLGYEFEMYEKMLEKMPRINSEVSTPNGRGIVVYNDILRERVSVKRQADGDSFVVEDFALEEINNQSKKPIHENKHEHHKKEDSENNEIKENKHSQKFNKNKFGGKENKNLGEMNGKEIVNEKTIVVDENGNTLEEMELGSTTNEKQQNNKFKNFKKNKKNFKK